MNSLRIKKLTYKTGLYAALAIVALIMVFPFIYLALSSFQPRIALYAKTSVWEHLFPSQLTLRNWERILSAEFSATWGSTWMFISNSLIAALGTVGVSMLIAIFPAYGFARFLSPFNRVLLQIVLLIYAVPDISIVLPLYQLLQRIGLLNTSLGLILALSARTLPFAIFLLMSFFKELPRDFEDAAQTDGCSRLGAFLRVVLPMAKAGLAVSAIYAFIGAWSNFVVPQVVVTTQNQFVIPVALVTMMRAESIDWTMLVTFGTISTIPCIIFAGYLQKYIARGLVVG